MPAKSFSVLAGGTVSATGGTAQSFAETGIQIPAGCNVADFTEEDQRIRPNVTLKVRPIRSNPDGSFTKGKTAMTLVVPKERANGSIAYPLIRIEVEDDAESTTTEIDNLFNLGAQLCIDADLANFRRYKSLNT
jgi:hypothetical protein